MVIIEMENGKQIKLELYPDKAPITVENFLKLVSAGFYDGLIFHLSLIHIWSAGSRSSWKSSRLASRRRS